MTATAPGSSVRTRSGLAVGMLIALILVALNMRAPITGVSSLLGAIRVDLGLSATAAGGLTTLPVLCLAIFAFLAPRLIARFGEEMVLAGCLAVLLAGVAIRVTGSAAALFAGTVLLGAGIGVANIAVPGLIKRDFPDRVSLLTAGYTVSLTAGGAVASGIVVPLSDALNSPWQWPLALLGLPVVVAIGFWLPMLSRRPRRAVDTTPVRGLWADRRAKQVALFMGMQSLLAYVVFGWLPSITHDHGLSAAESGYLLAVSTVVQSIGSMLVPALTRRGRDQRAVAFGVPLLTMAGLAGVFLIPNAAGIWISSLVLGLGVGSGFGLALTLIALRSTDARTVAGLNAMAQGSAYLMAAVGPFVVGLLHDLTGGWMVPMVLLLLTALGQSLAGLLAGRSGYVLEHTAPAGAELKPTLPYSQST